LRLAGSLQRELLEGPAQTTLRILLAAVGEVDALHGATDDVIVCAEEACLLVGAEQVIERLSRYTGQRAQGLDRRSLIAAGRGDLDHRLV
jgi:hypothetical protein